MVVLDEVVVDRLGRVDAHHRSAGRVGNDLLRSGSVVAADIDECIGARIAKALQHRLAIGLVRLVARAAKARARRAGKAFKIGRRKRGKVGEIASRRPRTPWPRAQNSSALVLFADAEMQPASVLLMTAVGRRPGQSRMSRPCTCLPDLISARTCHGLARDAMDGLRAAHLCLGSRQTSDCHVRDHDCRKPAQASWLAEPERLWAPWKLEGATLDEGNATPRSSGSRSRRMPVSTSLRKASSSAFISSTALSSM